MTEMATDRPDSGYALGSTDGEHERLIKQAVRFLPFTERLFRDAGVGPGQRVLELGIGNVTFVQCDASELRRERPFDAAVGRLILQYLPDPVAVLRSVSQLVRRGGAIAFQEPSFKPYFALCSEMPLWSACGSLAVAAFQGAGANAEMGPELPGVFERAGLPSPKMRMEMSLGNDLESARWTSDLLKSLLPQIKRLDLSVAKVGDFETLPERLSQEAMASGNAAPCVALIGAWCTNT